MAGNEWINGYLEAILDARAPGFNVECQSPVIDAAQLENTSDTSFFNPTKYFVEEVVTGYDESDLHKTWMKVTAMRNSQERNTRMENLCWRIWHLTRRKKQVEYEDATRIACRRIEREQGHKDATEELAEELSDGEKVDTETVLVRTFTRNFSDLEISNEQGQKRKSLYVVLISVHGLVRGEDMELGRDSDTGGQVKYVVELARALATMPEVYRVDLLTRQISSPDIHWSYGEPTEMLTDKSFDVDISNDGESSGAYIVRIPCGPRDIYLHKELLWPHIQEFVDGCLTHILNMAKVLGDQINDGERYVWPHVIHGHYADAGDIAALLSGALNVPMVLTGHSLGRNKMEQLLQQGRQTREDIDSTYKIMRRIEGEELSLDTAELVITSTQQEIEEQWGLYDGFDVNLERVLRLRAKRGVNCHGRYMPRMVVIPPGMDFSNMIAPDAPGDALDSDHETTLSDPGSPLSEPPIWSEIKRFFNNPHKPIILALSRPDPKKNLTKLLKAFGECKPLRDLANLTLIMGNREDIDEMSSANAAVLTTVLKLIDKHNLYGQVAYPKHHKQSDIPDVYRLAARTKGVFINPALVEPFGLTLIEAAAHGLPMVATRNGGPVDIHRALNNGLLVDPHDEKSISDALLRLVSDRNLWAECRRNGLKNIHLFSWPQHCRTYLARIALCRMRHPLWKDESNDQLDEEMQSDSLRDVNDLSLRLSIEDKLTTNGSSEMMETQDKAAQNGHAHIMSNFKHELEKVRKEALPYENESYRTSSAERSVTSNSSLSNKVPYLRRKRKFMVIALDLYNACGMPDHALVQSIKEIIRATKTNLFPRPPGYILSTALSLKETVEILRAGELQCEFDALICSSGSELYYSASNAHDLCNGTWESQLFADPDYATHIEYRWGEEGLKKTMARLLNIEEAGERIIAEDHANSNSHCLCYEVQDSSKVPKVNELRKKLRMRGLRCHAIYCRNESRLHVLPLLASRAQALRYLFVRWGADLSNMYVFVGETGDTDYEEQLSGVHKTVILRGSVENGCDGLLRGGYSYHREDVIPLESPHIVRTDHGADFEEIQNAIRRLA